MAKQTLILAKSITEANAYARVVGLPRFTYRPVRNAGSIRGIRNADVHILPSFLGRLDRHAILGALRWAKLEVFYVDYRDGKIHDGTEGDARFVVNPDGTTQKLAGVERFDDYAFPQRYVLGQTPEGPTLDDYERAYILNEHHDAMKALDDEETSGEETGAPEPSEDPAPVEEKPRRRRRTRCADCGNLHYREEPCPEVDEEEQQADDNGFAQRPAPVDFNF